MAYRTPRSGTHACLYVHTYIVHTQYIEARAATSEASAEANPALISIMYLMVHLHSTRQVCTCTSPNNVNGIPGTNVDRAGSLIYVTEDRV